MRKGKNCFSWMVERKGGWEIDEAGASAPALYVSQCVLIEEVVVNFRVTPAPAWNNSTGATACVLSIIELITVKCRLLISALEQ